MLEYPAVKSDQVQYSSSSMDLAMPQASYMQELITSDHSMKMAELMSN